MDSSNLDIVSLFLNLEHVRDIVPITQSINNVSVILPFNKQDSFARHYRTSIPSRVTMANSCSEKVTTLFCSSFLLKPNQSPVNILLFGGNALECLDAIPRVRGGEHLDVVQARRLKDETPQLRQDRVMNAVFKFVDQQDACWTCSHQLGKREIRVEVAGRFRPLADSRARAS